ncbi:MAG: 2Fe-2S iron-sulfur cluster-binding protein [Clostridia bacterium]|nr:2Fe-2S iron-sulfur cluster-binding protein [Clostridia bacterium]
MPVITFKPSGRSAIVPDGAPLLDAAKLACVSVETPCGGNGLCGKCIVKIESGKVRFDNGGILSDDLVG